MLVSQDQPPARFSNPGITRRSPAVTDSPHSRLHASMSENLRELERMYPQRSLVQSIRESTREGGDRSRRVSVEVWLSVCLLLSPVMMKVVMCCVAASHCLTNSMHSEKVLAKLNTHSHTHAELPDFLFRGSTTTTADPSAAFRLIQALWLVATLCVIPTPSFPSPGTLSWRFSYVRKHF